MTKRPNDVILNMTNPVLTDAPTVKEDNDMSGAKITVLYCRLSQEDERQGESLSIEHHDVLYQGGFLPSECIMTAAHLW